MFVVVVFFFVFFSCSLMFDSLVLSLVLFVGGYFEWFFVAVC